MYCKHGCTFARCLQQPAAQQCRSPCQSCQQRSHSIRIEQAESPQQRGIPHCSTAQVLHQWEAAEACGKLPIEPELTCIVCEIFTTIHSAAGGRCLKQALRCHVGTYHVQARHPSQKLGHLHGAGRWPERPPQAAHPRQSQSPPPRWPGSW